MTQSKSSPAWNDSDRSFRFARNSLNPRPAGRARASPDGCIAAGAQRSRLPTIWERKTTMTISVGDRVPAATFRTMTPDGPAPKTSDDIFKGKKVVLFAVPGAFTPTCHKNHMPGFVKNADAIKAKGIDTIAVTAVNDVFVMDAWKKASGAEGKIEFLADGSADFAKALGLSLDASANGLGIRSKRYCMVIDDGVVKSIAIEDAPGKAELSGADNLLKQI